MLDPFPLPPPSILIRATLPLSTKLGLHTLPLHVHEVIFAAALYLFTEQVVSPWLSRKVVPEAYARLSRKSRLNWDVHVVSFVQSLLICSLSLWVIWFDQERARLYTSSDKNSSKGGNADTRAGVGSKQWEGRIWGYYGSGGLCQSFALGYFLWDLWMCCMNVSIFGWGMLAHAVSAVAVFGLGYRPFIYTSAPIFLLYELSSPFLNVHWFCDKLALTGSVYQAVNGVFLVTTFFSCRIVWGLWNSFYVFRDIWGAVRLGHTSFTLRVPDGQVQGAYSVDQLLAISRDAQGQLTAFNHERFTPLWIPAVYLTSNLILNSLNVYWFGKMIETIRTRFPPPYGTKGTEADAYAHQQQGDYGALDEKAADGDAKGGERRRRHSIAQLNPEGGTVEEEVELVQDAAAEAGDALAAVASSPAALAAGNGEKKPSGGGGGSGSGSVKAARERAEVAMNGPVGRVEDVKMGGGNERLVEAEDGDVSFGIGTGTDGKKGTTTRSRRKA